ncbi:MAG: hypothetical protein HC875_00575 [Anaerolineales bacterium]|nr:hypothetical protein [Anaerolineales bacterium]
MVNSSPTIVQNGGQTAATIAGSMKDSTPQDMYEALQFIETGQVQVEKLISHTPPLEDLQQGFELVKHQRGLKVMVKISEESI